MELLCPAGNQSHIDVALENNVDAVYGGLKEWNARHKALNFSINEYNEVIKKLHANNIKFFLTLNTLVLDNEMIDIIQFLKEPTTELPDAFIVADIGLIKELKKEFPNIELHFSTQFGIHNLDDIELAISLNADRVILARELTKSEIDYLRANTSIDIECFIWGSQCLSYSGLCFFGSLMNGGSGNRGKCIITCRDVYSIDNNEGHLLYIPDLDCTNLLPELSEIDCIKLEGRRRPAAELDKIIKQIKNKDISKNETGFIYGKKVKDNNLYENINSRTKPIFKGNELDEISPYDIFMEFENNHPLKFSRDLQNENVYYVYSEYKKPYSLYNKNLSLDLTIRDGYIEEILYLNYKGEGKTFSDEYGSLSDYYEEISIDQLVNKIEHIYPSINVYKIKYKRNKDNKYLINKNVLTELLEFTKNDYQDKKIISKKNNFGGIQKLYLETNDLNVVSKFINQDYVKIIYSIGSKENLKVIDTITEKYGDKIIYKLPIFNWDSEDLTDYYIHLENKEVMFTKVSQLFKTKHLTFKRKYVDYSIYVWNKNALEYLKSYDIDVFTVSPELSFEQNIKIFDNSNIQFIIGGKLPLVYTRQCFDHLYGCMGCTYGKSKCIQNKDKEMDFKIICEKDHRFLISNVPILNDFTKHNCNNLMTFRYVTYGHTLSEIEESVEMFKNNDYYSFMKNNEIWKDSYECNLLEGRD